MKLNIIVDGNFMMFRTFSMFYYQELKKLKGNIKNTKSTIKKLTDEKLLLEQQQILKNYEDKLKEKELNFFNDDKRVIKLVQKIIMDFYAAIRPFDGVNRVLFVSDGNSWRKDFDKDYKSNRTKNKKSSNIDYNYLFKDLYDEVKHILSNNRIECVNISNAEGDDLMKLFSKHFLDKNESSVIITADQDIYQVCDIENDNFVAVYNPKSKERKFVCVDGFNDILYKPKNISNDDWSHLLFGGGVKNDSGKFDIENIKKIISNDCQYIEIDTNIHVFKKIIQGDDGDDVKPCYFTSKPNKNGVIRRTLPTGKKYDFIINNASTNSTELLFNSTDERSKLAKVVIESFKHEATDELIELVSANIKNNIILMSLEDYVMPENLKCDFKSYIQDNSNIKKYKKSNYRSALIGTKFEVGKTKSEMEDDNITDKLNKLNTDFLNSF